LCKRIEGVPLTMQVEWSVRASDHGLLGTALRPPHHAAADRNLGSPAWTFFIARWRLKTGTTWRSRAPSRRPERNGCIDERLGTPLRGARLRGNGDSELPPSPAKSPSAGYDPHGKSQARPPTSNSSPAPRRNHPAGGHAWSSFPHEIGRLHGRSRSGNLPAGPPASSYPAPACWSFLVRQGRDPSRLRALFIRPLPAMSFRLGRRNVACLLVQRFKEMSAAPLLFPWVEVQRGPSKIADGRR